MPFPVTRPFNVVFHGDRKFDYGHYGVHLGQEDRLTFLGHCDHLITARFIDCRSKSPTARMSLEVKFSPSSEWELIIPPGVAHTFDNLEGVNTINTYRVLLPDPSEWLNGSSKWVMDSDIINIPENSDPSKVELVEQNSLEASKIFYRVLADLQRNTLPQIQHEHPYTANHKLPDGSIVQLKIRERVNQARADPEQLCEMAGLMWITIPFVKTGPESGITPLVSERPFYIVDHGSENYTHDAFGIHKGQDDILLFLGPTDQMITAEFVDCRRGSPTIFRRHLETFSPSAFRVLSIPRGIAHRFEHLENVFTLNQGVMFAEVSEPYDAENDVLDWPRDAKEFPTIDQNTEEFSLFTYEAFAEGQVRALKSTAADHSTPVVLLAKDEHGKEVRVAIRRGT